MAFCWRADDGPLKDVFGSSLPNDLIKKKRKVIVSLTFSDKVMKKAKIRNRYNQTPHLTQDTTWGSVKTQENMTYREPRG